MTSSRREMLGVVSVGLAAVAVVSPRGTLWGQVQEEASNEAAALVRVGKASSALSKTRSIHP